MELWDAYLPEGTLAGVDLSRGEPIPAGLYHLVVSAVIRSRVDGRFLLLRRDPGKDTHPGVFEVSCGGAVLKGETPEEGIRREVEEESGIRDGIFTPLYRETGPHTFYHGFLCLTAVSPEEIRLQPGETTEARWMTQEELMTFCREHPKEIFLQRGTLPYLEIVE